MIFGFFLLIVQYLQLVQGYDALGAAMALAPMAVPVLLLSLIAPRLTGIVGLRLMSVVGVGGIAVGMILLSRLSVDSGYWDILWPLFIAAAGLGLSTAPATSAIVSDIPVDEQGVAAAVNDAMREVGAAIGIAIGGSILAGRYAADIVDILPGVPEAGRQAVEVRSPGPWSSAPWPVPLPSRSSTRRRDLHRRTVRCAVRARARRGRGRRVAAVHRARS